MNNKNVVIYALLAVTIVVTICAIGGCARQQDASTVSFGYQPFGSNLPFFVAVEKGFFEEQGVTVEPMQIISANDAANAIINGELVGNATVPLNVLLNIEENQPGLMKIFMVKAISSAGNWSDYLLVKKGSPIDSLAQLRGKKVGGFPGSAQQTLVRLILRQFMTEDAITTVELPPGVQLQALDAGQVDALITYDERAIIALQEGIAEVLVENPISKYVVDPMYGFPYVLSTEFVEENPEVARKIRDAMYKAADFIESNEAEARQIMAKWGGTRPEIAEKVNLWAQVKAEDIDREALQKLADIFYEAGVVSKRIDTSNLYLTEEDLR